MFGRWRKTGPPVDSNRARDVIEAALTQDFSVALREQNSAREQSTGKWSAGAWSAGDWSASECMAAVQVVLTRWAGLGESPVVRSNLRLVFSAAESVWNEVGQPALDFEVRSASLDVSVLAMKGVSLLAKRAWRPGQGFTHPKFRLPAWLAADLLKAEPEECVLAFLAGLVVTNEETVRDPSFAQLVARFDVFPDRSTVPRKRRRQGDLFRSENFRAELLVYVWRQLTHRDSQLVTSAQVLALAALHKSNPFVVRHALSQFIPTVERTTAHHDFLCTVLEPSAAPTCLVASVLLYSGDLKRDLSDVCVLRAVSRSVIVGLMDPALRATALRVCFEFRDCPLVLSLLCVAGARSLVADILRTPEPEAGKQLEEWHDTQGTALDALRVLREPPPWVFEYCIQALKRQAGPLDKCRLWMLGFMLRTEQGRPLTRAEVVSVANNRGWQTWTVFFVHENLQGFLPGSLADLVAQYLDEQPAPEEKEMEQLASVIAANFPLARGVFEKLSRFGPLGAAYQAIVDGSPPDHDLLDKLPVGLAVELLAHHDFATRRAWLQRGVAGYIVQTRLANFLEILSPGEQQGLLHTADLGYGPVTPRKLACRVAFYRAAAGWFRLKTCSEDTVIRWLRQIEHDLTVTHELAVSQSVLASPAQDLVVRLVAGLWLFSPELLDASDRLSDRVPMCAELSSCRGPLADLLLDPQRSINATASAGTATTGKIRAQAYVALHQFEAALGELHALVDVHHSVHAEIGAVFKAWAMRVPRARASLLAQADKHYSIALQTEHRRDWILARSACSSVQHGALDYLWLRSLGLHTDKDQLEPRDPHDQDDEEDARIIQDATGAVPIKDNEASLARLLEVVNGLHIRALLRQSDTNDALHMMMMLAVLTPAAMTAVHALDDRATCCRRLTRKKPTCVGAWLAFLETDRTFDRAQEVLLGLTEAHDFEFSRVDILPPRRPAAACICLWVRCRELLKDMDRAPQERFRTFRLELARLVLALVGVSMEFPEAPEEKQQVSTTLADLAPCWWAYVETCVEMLGLRLVFPLDSVRSACLEELGSELARPSHPVVWCGVLMLMATRSLVRQPHESGWFYDLARAKANDLDTPSIPDWSDQEAFTDKRICFSFSGHVNFHFVLGVAAARACRPGQTET
jgi:hypothetical protein